MNLLMGWEDEGETIQEEASKGVLEEKTLVWPRGPCLLLRSGNANRRASPRAIGGNICLVYLKPHSWSVGKGQF